MRRDDRVNAQTAEDSQAARLLVVDDNVDNCEVLRRRLQRRGYVVRVAMSGDAALAELARETFDAVLLDIEMPDISGLEVLARVRERHSKTELPVVMATAQTASEQMVEAFRLGANDYVTKPLDFPVVVARLESHLAVRRELRAVSSPPVVLAPSEDLPAGTVLDGRYRVDTLLGGGGFAVVYAGVQISTGLPVAIKLLRSRRLLYSDARSELARFELEMRAIAQVTHPAIVRLVDSGSVVARPESSSSATLDPAMATTKASLGVGMGGAGEQPLQRRSSGPPREQQVPYIVMEKLVGPTLEDELLESGALPVARAVDILLPILDGMQLVHEQGIVHRDVKPSNIVLSRSPRTAQGLADRMEPKIVDFGIAKLIGDEGPALTRTASAVGTPAYMSPEQASAAPVVDGRSDQYTLGTVLFECLTGKPPCRGTSSIELLQQIAAGTEVERALRASAIDAALKPVLATALSRLPEDRFRDLRAFGEALLPFASPAGRANWQRLRAEVPSGIKPVPGA
jgi:serine/threonine-protein kinase